jgi:acyl-CoA dehydrogenase
MPPMSQTEREAVEAGTVWWDGDLFSGRPDWAELLAVPQPKLTAAGIHVVNSPADIGAAMKEAL